MADHYIERQRPNGGNSYFYTGPAVTTRCRRCDERAKLVLDTWGDVLYCRPCLDLMSVRSEREERREARREAIRQHLAQGGQVEQFGAIWPGCSPFMAGHNTPERLAAHIEKREYGFGWETVLL